MWRRLQLTLSQPRKAEIWCSLWEDEAGGNSDWQFEPRGLSSTDQTEAVAYNYHYLLPAQGDLLLFAANFCLSQAFNGEESLKTTGKTTQLIFSVI